MTDPKALIAEIRGTLDDLIEKWDIAPHDCYGIHSNIDRLETWVDEVRELYPTIIKFINKGASHDR
jgi:hypothetical protein